MGALPFNKRCVMNDFTKFFMVCSELRLQEGCTPYMRARFATESEAIETAKEWAAKSDHGGIYTVYECRAVGSAQKSTPPVDWKPVAWRS